ncbi:hypothetical protein [Streptomyces sp. NPDC046942]
MLSAWQDSLVKYAESDGYKVSWRPSPAPRPAAFAFWTGVGGC